MSAAGASGPISPFAIPAAAGATYHARRVLKNGNSFAVFDEFGHAQAAGPAAEGLFFEDTRYLSRLAVTIGGMPPRLLSSTVAEDNTVLAVDLTNPDLAEDAGPPLATQTVHILNSIVLGKDALFATLEIRNFGVVPATVELAIEFAADFADMFEVRGSVRPRRGALLMPVQQDKGPVLAYRGLDGVTRRTSVVFDPVPETASPSHGAWAVRLPPGGMRAIQLEIHCDRDGRPPGRSSRAQSLMADRRAHAERRARVARITTSNANFDEWLRCSRADLDMLATETPHGTYPYAGIPWFSTAFGRDGLITALECLWLDPDLAAGTLRFLAANQATAIDPKVDAEPGKILHETRLGEMAALGEVPFGKYYGSIDATPLFVVLAAAHYERTGDLALVRALWPHIEAALGWMTVYGDHDGDGFIEYRRKSSDGLDNQGWKDSSDAIFHSDGSLAEAPIAPVEVQAYAYAAYLGAAGLARALGHAARAAGLETMARQLEERFEAVFWQEDLGIYALALDGAKRPCRVRSSNAGHALLTGIARPERARRLAETLLSPDSFSGWGIRTIAAGQPRYNPMSYHNGSVWPHDNALIAMGLARCRLKDPLRRVWWGLFDAASRCELKRLPELFCGFERRTDMGPTAYPLACAPQAWSAAAVFGLLGAALGISFAPREHRIGFAAPLLPEWLDQVSLSNLRLGEASVDLVLRRDGDTVALDVVRHTGPVEVALLP